MRILPIIFVLSIATTAYADRVVIVPPVAPADASWIEELQRALSQAAAAVGHQAITLPSGDPRTPVEPPQTAEELKALAEVHSAQYVVVGRATPLPGQYRLSITVGYAPLTRSEEIEVNVLQSEQDQRLRDVLRAMLRPSGLGEDAVRLTEYETDPSSQAGRSQNQEQLLRRQALLERERERAARERARERAAWENRPRYGVDRPWIALIGLDGRVLLAHDADRKGGSMLSLALRGGVAIRQVPGLEARAGLDIVGGNVSGIGLSGGGVYLTNPFEFPLFIGGGGELGILFLTTGSKDPALVVRGGPTASFRAGSRFYIEATLPELMYLGVSGGALTLGLSARAGYRF